MTVIGTVSEIWRFPAKSMGGETVPSSDVTVKDGIAGDRRWAVRDEELREIVNARRIPKILMLGARFTGKHHPGGEPQMEIALPGGESVLSDDPYVHAVLSAFLGRRVSLQHLRPRSDTGHFKYGHFVTPKDLRRILGRPPHGPLADPSRLRFPNLIEILRFSVQRGTYFDLSRLHIVTTASLHGLQQMLPDSRIDVRRFRPNLVIDTGSALAPFEEHGWAGWSLRIGGVAISVHSPAIRCTMPGQAQPGLPADQNVQITLRKQLNEDFGVYADVLTDGAIRVGGPVELIPPKSRIANRIVRVLNTGAIKALGAPNALVDKLEQFGARRTKPGTAAKPGRDYRAMRVVETRSEGEGAVSLVLAPEAPLPWPEFLPGQHLALRLEIPGQARPVYRSYSISNPPGETGRFRITVKREPAPLAAPGVPPGLASNFLCDHVRAGDRILARGPLGLFHLRPGDERPLVFLSCGIGVTPLLSMASAVAQSNPGRTLWWFHGARNDAQFALRDDALALQPKLPNLHLHVRYSQQGAAPNGAAAGRLDFGFVRERLPGLDFDFYLCGTPDFMAGFHKALRGAGVPQERIRHEFFSQGRLLEDAGGAASQATRPNVRFARTGRDLRWEPDAHSLLDLAERNGIPIEFGCRYGNCHACKATLISGEVHRLPLADPPPEPDAILLWSATPLGDIVLDA